MCGKENNVPYKGTHTEMTNSLVSKWDNFFHLLGGLDVITLIMEEGG